ncbi:hypothetical protein PSR59_01205 [Ligilactobacillus ruminis]|uniref:Uncharacterized protein n=1 Tax=Ligilactobacillus ruminis TaxID=1623 RepID=A0AAQ3ATL5_9LACO|nr:hypothetical protein [Ligilactobacillus ruminis]WDC82286.1 hypothetical protein PSR59_01205 [Ligilactobacillus ruminis]
MKFPEKISAFISATSSTLNFLSAFINRKLQNKRFLYGDRKAILIPLREMLEAYSNNRNALKRDIESDNIYYAPDYLLVALTEKNNYFNLSDIHSIRLECIPKIHQSNEKLSTDIRLAFSDKYIDTVISFMTKYVEVVDIVFSAYIYCLRRQSKRYYTPIKTNPKLPELIKSLDNDFEKLEHEKIYDRLIDKTAIEKPKSSQNI